MRLYLASSSPARLQLLRQAGIEPVVIPSRVDEEAALAAHAEASGCVPGQVPAREVAGVLARAKALEVARRDGVRDPVTGGPLDGLVLGGDSVFEIGGVAYGKPRTPQRARERWLAQRGATGTLWSGHWLVDARSASADGGTGSTVAASGIPEAPAGRAPGRGGTAGADGGADGIGEVTGAMVRFAADLDEAEIDAYIASGEPLEVAGAFTIDSLGAAFIDRIEGDPSTVVGMSLPALRRMVRSLGVPWQSLWASAPRGSA